MTTNNKAINNKSVNDKVDNFPVTDETFAADPLPYAPDDDSYFPLFFFQEEGLVFMEVEGTMQPQAADLSHLAQSDEDQALVPAH